MRIRASILRGSVVLLICGLLFAHILWLSFICDDAFIAFRYSKHLVDGNGLVYNIGERIEGYTSFLWVLICALVLWLGGRPDVWALWISGACAILTLLVFTSFRRQKHSDSLILAILLVSNGGFAAWATGGLETMLFTSFVTVACVIVLRILKSVGASSQTNDSPTKENAKLKSQFWLLSLLLLFAALTRPEGVLITVLCTVLLVAFARQKRIPIKRLTGPASVWIILYGAYFLWRYLYYDRLFPNTFYVKVSSLDLISSGIEYMLYAALRFHWYLLIIPALVLLLTRHPLGIAKEVRLVGSVVVLPYLAYVCIVGGDFMDMFRFVVPVLPMILLVVVDTWHAFYRLLISKLSRRLAIATVGLLLACVIGLRLFTSVDSQRIWYRHGLDSIGLLRQYSEEWTKIGQRLKNLISPADSLATTAAGIIPYLTDVYSIDQLGLTSSTSVEELVPRSTARPGHQFILSGEALHRLKPQYILGHPSTYSSSEEMRLSLFIEEGWSDTILADYEVRLLRLPTSPNRHFPIAIRRDVRLTSVAH